MMLDRLRPAAAVLAALATAAILVALDASLAVERLQSALAGGG